MPVCMEVGLSPGNIVLDGDLAPPPQNGHSPQFSAHVYCGQTAGWIKMPLGMEVSLGSGDFVLDGNQLPQKGAQPPLCDHVYCGQMAGWITMPLDTEVDLSPGDFVSDGNRAPLPKKGAESPVFGPCVL